MSIASLHPFLPVPPIHLSFPPIPCQSVGTKVVICLALSCSSPQTFVFYLLSHPSNIRVWHFLAPAHKHSCLAPHLPHPSNILVIPLVSLVKHSCLAPPLLHPLNILVLPLVSLVKHSCLAPSLLHPSNIRVWHLPCPTCQTFVFGTSLVPPVKHSCSTFIPPVKHSCSTSCPTIDKN